MEDDLPVESRRMIMLHDGRCLGLFTSGINKDDDMIARQHNEEDMLETSSGPATAFISTTAILLEENGSSFSHVGSDGRVQRHLTRFPLHHLVHHVKATTRFRNRHRPRPYMCSRFYPKRVPTQVR